jgi:hypothetical protein
MRLSVIPATALGVIAAALLAFAPAASADEVCADIDETPQVVGIARSAAAVGCLVNHERTAAGLGTLAVQPQLTTAAQLFSIDMGTRGFFSHDSPDGKDPGDRITAAGFNWGAYGENIAYGQRTPREVMTAWLASEGHCENLMTPGFTVVGYGVAIFGDRVYWTQDFGRPISLGGGPSRAGAPSCPRAPTPFGGTTPAAAPVQTADPAPVATPTRTTTTATVKRAGKRLQVKVALPGSTGKLSLRIRLQQGGRTVRDLRARVPAGTTQQLDLRLKTAGSGSLLVTAGKGRTFRVRFG